MSSEEKTFNPETVQTVFKHAWKNENSKANKEAILLSCEFLRLFVVEAINRSSEEQQSMDSSSNTIDVEHLERILPQLLLDF